MFHIIVNSVLEERRKLHVNDPSVQVFWDKLTMLLSEDEQQTITFINHCAKEDILLLSEIFEDISLNLKSQNFIETLKNIQTKYSDLDLNSSIEIAEKYSRL